MNPSLLVYIWSYRYKGALTERGNPVFNWSDLQHFSSLDYLCLLFNNDRSVIVSSNYFLGYGLDLNPKASSKVGMS